MSPALSRSLAAIAALLIALSSIGAITVVPDASAALVTQGVAMPALA
ncbi:MAG: hypothetical protein RIB52_03945 [Erythrobacter sp.]|mgnify:FL=1